MKKFVYLLSLLLLSFNAFALIGNTNNGTSTDPIGQSINAARFLAPSNMVVGSIYAKVVGSGGKYKCAIYTGSATLPSTFIRGTSERTITTSGWYSFPLTSNVSITNGQNYWLAVWSDNSASANFYTSGGTLRWVTTSPYSATWPTTLTTDAGAAFNYCIYAQDVVPVTPPTSTNYSSVTLAWDASPSVEVTGYRIYQGGSTRTYTNSFNAGNNLQLTVTNLVQGQTYYFTATAYDAAGVESIFSNEVSYSLPIGNPIPTAPVIIRFYLTP